MQKAPTIAIVDDDDAVRLATGYLVRSLGFDTEDFASADEFLRASPARTWSCIISDVNMPGTSGIELQRRLAAEGWNVPFVFITAFPDKAIEERALKAGAIGFLSKPFDSAALAACLERAVRQIEFPNQH